MHICVEFDAHFYGCLYSKKKPTSLNSNELGTIIIISSDVERFSCLYLKNKHFLSAANEIISNTWPPKTSL